VLIGSLILVADGMYAVASTKGLLTVVAVLSSLYPVVTIGLAQRYLGERIERLQPLGIAVALGGAAAISAASA
jgi:drug/metabolite transporter (DMT)-like permease